MVRVDVGQRLMDFCERHQCLTDEDLQVSASLQKKLCSGELSRLRFGWADQHGLVRGKTLYGERAAQALAQGLGFVGTNLLKDSSDHTTRPVFSAGAGFASGDFQGAADVILVPVPETFRMLPWSPGTGWIQCQTRFSDGRRVLFDTRDVLRRTLDRAAELGWSLLVGLEVECHIFKLDEAALTSADLGWPGRAPSVSPLSQGYRLLSEQRYDRLEPVLDLLTAPLLEMGLPLDSVEIELGPSQVELVFGPQPAMQAADTMLFFRHAAKQIMHRHGYHISFMCRPRVPEVMSSGWHLHQSLVQTAGGRNVFMAEPGAGTSASGGVLSVAGTQYLAGLLANGHAATAFSTPTINGYRRYRPNALAPERVNWGRDNRGAMIRLIGEVGQGSTRLENRIGEPAANPYLYIASQLAAGLDGVERALEPPPAADEPYSQAFEPLPRTLDQAVEALAGSQVFRNAFGAEFIDYYLQLKQFELARFNLDVSEWEQREYFDLF